MRLQKLLAHAGVASRRRAEELITTGAVTVNGAVVTTLGVQVDEARDRVELNGRRIRVEEPLYRVLLKPRGCLCTLARTDPEREAAGRRSRKPTRKGEASEEKAAPAENPARPTLARHVKDTALGWQVVAPLDYLAEGVILLTTDGALSERMSRGGGHVPMTYHLKMQGKVGDEEITRLLRGWKWDGHLVRPTQVEALATTGKNTWIEMVVPESRSRVLKAAGETIRHTVLKISRVRLGEISFEGLAMGGWRDLNKGEIKNLKAAAGSK